MAGERPLRISCLLAHRPTENLNKSGLWRWLALVGEGMDDGLGLYTEAKK